MAQEKRDRFKVTRESALKNGHGKVPIMRVIRAKCMDCCAGQAPEVRMCPVTECALWPYRMGRSPFHGQAK